MSVNKYLIQLLLHPSLGNTTHLLAETPNIASHILLSCVIFIYNYCDAVKVSTCQQRRAILSCCFLGVIILWMISQLPINAAHLNGVCRGIIVGYTTILDSEGSNIVFKKTK